MDRDRVRRQILKKITRDIFMQKRMANNFRGLWTEYMVAEALGDECRIVSENWHPWDLQIGKSTDEFPERIRIQVKNTARLQSWHQLHNKPSYCFWTLRMGRKPWYFEAYNKNVPCEDYGHLCDVYVLCFHPIDDPAIADHRDPGQWEFYVVPVTPRHQIYRVFKPRAGQKSRPSYTVVPASLRKGIRGRPPIAPLTFDQLSLANLRAALEI